MLPAIEKGFFQREIAASAYRYQREIDAGDRVIVGVNEYVSEEPEVIEYLRLDREAERRQRERLERLRRDRDDAKVRETLDRLRKAAEGEENLMPAILACVRASATLGETTRTLKEVFGVYEEPLIF